MQELPHSIEAEQALLGAIITDNEALEQVAEYLLPHHFSVNEHSRIYEETKRLIDDNKTANTITLADAFADELESVGGVPYFADLLSSCVTVINCGEYGKIIFDLAIKRDLIHLSEATIDMVGTQAEHGETIEFIERELTALTDENSNDVGSPASQMDEALADIEAAYKGDKPPGLETGLIDLDDMVGRLRDGNVYVIGARPGMGKSILALQIAEKIADTLPVLFFSLEMPAREVHQRRISTAAGINFSALRNGDKQIDIKKAIDCGNALKLKPLYIDDTGGVTIEYIRRHARRQKRKTGLSAILVDYLQLMSGDGNNRVETIGNITRGLKSLAKEMKCPLVLLSQLNRGLESRDSQVPRMSDLRESGDIEQDADVVLFLHREHYFLDQRKVAQKEGETQQNFQARLDRHTMALDEAKGLADLIIAKNRQGVTGMLEAGFNGAHMNFTNLARD